MLGPLALINRVAQLVPPPRTHRHRYYGVGKATRYAIAIDQWEQPAV